MLGGSTVRIQGWKMSRVNITQNPAQNNSIHNTPQWGAADAEIKVPSGENTELKRSPLKPGVGQYIAIRAMLTARDFFLAYFYPSGPPQWGAVDAEIKVPSGENTELKQSPFKARSMSVYSHIRYAYCQGFLPCLFLPFWSIHLHVSKTSPDFSCVGCG